jgi:hypothetical protein
VGECKFIKRCKFFESVLKDKPSTAELFRARYCKGGYRECARYIAYNDMGIKKLPDNLFPNQTEKLKTLKKKNG